MMHLSVSNYMEALLDGLFRALIEPRPPFFRRYIIVPNGQVQGYLKRSLALKSSNFSSMGVSIDILERALPALLGLDSIPTHYDFALALYEAGIPPEEIEGFTSLFLSFLFEDETSSGGVFEKKAKALFDKILEKHPEWQLPQERHTSTAKEETKFELYIFGFSFLPSSFHKLFLELAATHGVFYFLLSPSMMFWSDLLPEHRAHKEEMKLLKQVESFEQKEKLHELFKDSPSLLANCMRQQAHFFSFLEETIPQGEEGYVIADGVACLPPFSLVIRQEEMSFCKKGADLLHLVQADLLLLFSSHSPRLPIRDDDGSIQIHSMPTRLAEIKHLYDTLSALSYERPLLVGSIRVIAPDIAAYIPYIDQVFGSKESLFSYQILKKGEWKREPYIEALYALLEVLAFPQDVRKLHFLFSRLAFYKKLGLESDDIELLSSFLSHTNFQKGEFEEEFFKNWTNGSQDVQDGARLGYIVMALLAIQEEKNKLKENKTCDEWLLWLDEIGEKYLQFEKGKERIFAIIEKMRKQALFSSLSITLGQFLPLFSFALEEFQREESLYREVVFSSYDGLYTPSEVVCLIGMEQGVHLESRSIIEALLSSRSLLYISFQGISYEDHQELPPATCVEELIRFIEKGYTLTRLLQRHQLSEYYHEEKVESRSFSIISTCPKESEIVHIDELKRAFYSPLRLYFEELGIRMSEPSSLFPSFDRECFYSLLRKTMPASDEEFEEALRSHPQMPEGKLRQAACEMLREKRASIKKSGKEKGIDFEDLVTIELCLSIKKPYEIEKGKFAIPAIECKNRRIVGTLRNLSPRGYFFLEKKSHRSFYRDFPSIAIREILSDQLSWQKGKIHFLGDEKEEAYTICPHNALEKAISFVSKCKKAPLALLPQHVDEILKGGFPEKVEDPYFQLLCARTDKKALHEMLPEWEKEAKVLFSGIEVQDV
jgi:exonuclease V gamma subunit